MIHKKLHTAVFIILIILSMSNQAFAALSVNAQRIIEKMRSELKPFHQVKTISSSDFNNYIPGQLLRKALDRLENKKGIFYEHQNSTIKIKGNRTIKTANKSYIPGLALAMKLRKVIKIIGKAPHSETVLPDFVSLNKKLNRSSQIHNNKIIKQSVAKSKYAHIIKRLRRHHTIHVLKHVLRHRKKITKLRYLTHNNSVASSSSHATAPKISNNEIQRFNETIKNNEFKMPRKYRTIVR